MAIEQKRGCGYRKVGGLYMVGGGIGVPCDRLPFELTVCACCGQGIKQALGWTWIDVNKFFNGPHVVANDNYDGLRQCEDAASPRYCELCEHPEAMGKAGLLWIGEKFYKSPADFVKEGVELGFSRRIRAIPHDFKVGQTWVMLAHKNTIAKEWTDDKGRKHTHKPGIFYAWMPQRIEKIVLESTRGTEEIEALEKRGIVPVFVPDNDPDHQGNVHDDFEREKKERKQ